MVNHEEFQPVAQPGQPIPMPRVLVADDEECLLLLLTQLLHACGCVVDTVGDGTAAWEALQSGAYELLITDHKMPKLSGLELIRKARAANMGLPIIMVAGELPPPGVDSLESLHLAATLLKPFAVEDFIDTVKGVLHDAIQTA